MELLPKAMVVGVFAAVQPGPSPVVTPEKINRIWAELAPRQGYRQLQLAPDGAGAQFFGSTGDDGAAIQLPLLQVRTSIATTSANAADEAQFALKAMANHLNLTQFYTLGIRQWYHAPVANNDARDFVLRRVLNKEEEDLVALERGGGLWGAAKFGALAPDGSQYTISIEPFHADNRFIYVDVDAQIPGPASLENVRDRAAEAAEYASRSVKEYLDRAEAAL